MKKYVLLLVLMLNLVPYLKDGYVKWTVIETSAQMVSSEYVCTDESGYTYASSWPCDQYAEACSCPTCGQQYDCDLGHSCNSGDDEEAECYCAFCDSYYTCDLGHTCSNSGEDEGDDGGGGSGSSGGSGGSGNGSSTDKRDCAGVLNGSAYIDNCSQCVGGTTGRQPCVKDCAGIAGGSAYIDECQECVGGTTGKDPCECEGDKCPICGGIVVIDDESDVGLRSAPVVSCRRCNCLRVYSTEKECLAYKEMFENAIAEKNEYIAMITERGVYTWKTETSKEGDLFGPFSPIFDSSKNQWYIQNQLGRTYIYGVAHVHWDPTDTSFSQDGDFYASEKLHGVPLYLFRANGTVDAICSPEGDGVHYISNINSYTVAELSNCNQSLIDFYLNSR